MAEESKPQSATHTAQHYSSFIEHLAAKLGLPTSAAAVYAPPVERNGVTIIPVAKVQWGFGGGSKDKGQGVEDGAGGGGAQVVPLGYIELKEGRAEFRRITGPAAFVPMVLASGFVSVLILRGLRKLLRA
jgi:uncharacterized spore protein YtfJ